MSLALREALDQKPQRGVYAAACFAHTGFDASKPFVSNVSYLEAFADFLFDRQQISNWLFDDCCSGSSVTFNPTC